MMRYQKLLRSAAISMAIWAAAWPATGWGKEWLSGALPDILVDPLNVTPPVLQQGKILPGDELPVQCPATVNFEQELALDDAMDLALCNNPQLKGSWANIKAQAAVLGEAHASYWPTLNVTLNRLNTRTTYPDMEGAGSALWGKTAYVNLGWRIFDFGARQGNRNAAQAALTAAIAQNDAALQKLLSMTVGAYFDVVTAQAVLESQMQSVRLAGQTLVAAKRREERGVGGRNDTLQASTALARVQLASQRAQGELNKAKSTLNYVLGISTNQPLKLPSAQAVVPAAQSMHELSQWLEAAQTQHPSIAAARAQWVAAQEKVTATRAEGLPTLDLVANYYQNGYPNQGVQSTRSNTSTMGISLTIPLFEGFARTYKIRAAQAQMEQSEAQLKDVEYQTLSEVVKAHADAQSALANIGASDELFKSAQEALESSMNRYERGVADVLEILSVQNALSEAKQERIRCLSQWQAARLQLWAVSGVLGLRTVKN